MITMISAKKAISVRLKTNSSDFVIRNLETGEEKVIPMVRLYGPNLKYRGGVWKNFPETVSWQGGYSHFRWRLSEIGGNPVF